ncbi:hypothetical protein [Streptomyces sp. NPDC090025]|uniref:hypothetical protein n=1 Tax=Streptomyces sp. NPDC090025 TaxID=3365922 RepID=UPI003837A0DE
MTSPCHPKYAPAGDVGGALFLIDSRLKAIYDGRTELAAEERELVAQFTASLDADGVEDLLDGACTIIFMFMKWLRLAYEDHDKDVIEGVLPGFVASLSVMTRNIKPETIPTMSGMVIAAGLDLSPSLWRKQFGTWTPSEMTTLEATAFLLAEHINRLTDDQDYATRLISEALAGALDGVEDEDGDG